MRRHKRRRDGTCATCMWYRPDDEGFVQNGGMLHTCAIEGVGRDRDSRLWMPPDGWCVMWDGREARHERLAR